MDGKINPKDKASFLSRFLLFWLFTYFRKTVKTLNSSQNFYKKPEDCQVTKSFKTLQAYWKNEKLKQNPSFLACLIKTYGKDYAYSLVQLGISMICVLIQSVLIGEFISYVFVTKDIPVGVLISVGITFSSIIGNIGNEKMFLYSGELSIRVKANCNQIIFNKLLNTRSADFEEGKLSSIITLLNTDLVSIMQLCMTTYVVLIPFYFFAASLLLYWKIGISGVITHFIMLLTIPILVIILQKFDLYKEQIWILSKERLRILNEAIEGIKILKIFSWESVFESKIISSRNKEITWYLKKSIFKMISFTIVTSFQGAFLLLAYSLKVQISGSLKLNEVFSGVCLLMSSHFYITACVSEGLVTLKLIRLACDRVMEVLLMPDVFSITTNDKGLVQLRSVFANWTKFGVNERSTDGMFINEFGSFCLKDANLFIGTGQLVAVVGPVGAGKSTLLKAILGECYIHEGEVTRPAKVSYLSQEPWVIEGTIRDNVLMGEEINENKYWNVIKLCQLEHDLKDMIKGDNTQVGEEGKLLSQGQKSRLALARCLYRDSDLYLMDDPFSSVDLNVAEEIMSKVVKEFLNGKTRILVINDIDLMVQFDKVLLISNGYIEFNGHYNTLVFDSNSMNLLQNHSRFKGRKQRLKNKFLIRDRMKKKGSVVKPSQMLNETVMNINYFSFKFSLLSKFLSYGFKSLSLFAIFIIFAAGLQVFYIFHQYLISMWSVEDNARAEARYYALALLVLTLIIIAGTLIRNTVLYVLIFICSRNLHNKAVNSILSAHIDSFYNKSPKDFIDSLSGDIFQIDENLTQAITFVIMFGIIIISYISYIIYVVPINLANISVFLIYSIFLIYYFTRPVIILRGNYIQSTGPITSICKETIKGISTIHSLNLSLPSYKRFKHKNLKLVSKFLNYFYCLRCYSTLVSFGASILFSLNFFFILIYIHESNSALMAVSMSFNISIMNILPWFFRLIIEIVILLPSVRRVESICSLTQEESTQSVDIEITRGKIEFENVTLVYKGFNEMALNDVSFKVKPGQKFGIIGRSGSGKSSILNALFRFTRLYDGKILIDGQDIYNCSVRSLRDQVSFMSQNPFIFNGSIKQNIDLDGKYSDEKVQELLNSAGLEDFLDHHGLHQAIQDSDLSAGQRQLLALCRVLIRNGKVLLMDEATSNMDQMTERKIEELIKKNSKNKTVLCIAHKLKLLSDYDLVMLIEDGYIVDILPPHQLLTRDPTLAKGFNY